MELSTHAPSQEQRLDYTSILDHHEVIGLEVWNCGVRTKFQNDLGWSEDFSDIDVVSF